MSCEILENFLRILFHNFSVPSRRQKHAKSSSGKKAFSIFVTTNSPFLTHKMSALGRPWRASLQGAALGELVESAGVWRPRLWRGQGIWMESDEEVPSIMQNLRWFIPDWTLY